VDEGLGGAGDASVAAAAAGEDRVLVTLDRGFGDIRTYPPGSHPGIVVIHASDQAPGILADLLDSFLAEHDLMAFEGCVVILEASRVRVRRPPIDE
jgi:predicted nuclease of predicted toxin-antitoxin system